MSATTQESHMAVEGAMNGDTSLRNLAAVMPSCVAGGLTAAATTPFALGLSAVTAVTSYAGYTEHWDAATAIGSTSYAAASGVTTAVHTAIDIATLPWDAVGLGWIWRNPIIGTSKTSDKDVEAA